MGCSACGRKSDKTVSVFQKVQNASKAIKRVALATVRGQPVFSEEELVQARMKVCMGCPRRKSTGNECLECGCPIGRKIKLATESCPQGKWSAHIK